MFDSIGIIGAGRIAHILLGGWKHTATALPPIRVYDVSTEALTTLKAAFPQVHISTLEETSNSDLLLLGVHPPVLADLLPQIRPLLRPEAVVCSLAPKLRLPQLQAQLGGFHRLARMNPNATSIIGQGMNPLVFSPQLPEAARLPLRTLFAPLGHLPEVADEQLESYAVISAMGPTYFWFQFHALEQLAESFGLARHEARQAIATMLHGAVDTLLASELPPEVVMDLVPVRPLADDEETITNMLATRLRAIHSKLNS